MAKERDVQRRPEQGIRWSRTQDFVDRLAALLEEKTSEEVAREVSATYGYEIDASMIRKLKTVSLEELPSSVLIGPICRHYRWPVPDAFDPNEELASLAAAAYELAALAPERAAKILRFARAERDAAREEAELLRTTPEDS
jgi:hypothetical protein